MNSTLTLSMPEGSELFVIFIILAIPFLLLLGALIDIIRSTFNDSQIKLFWAIVVIFLPFVGPLLYILIGRGQRTSAAASTTTQPN